MRNVLLLCMAALIGCGEDNEEARRAPINWQGPAPHVLVQVGGPESSSDKSDDCVRTVLKLGGVFDPQAAIVMVLYLQDSQNHLRIISRTRGVVRDEPRPGWTMERLCTDGFYAAVAAASQEARMPIVPPLMAPHKPVPGPPSVVILPKPIGTAADQFASSGVGLFDQGNFPEAIGQFIQARTLSHDPVLLFDIAVSYQSMNDVMQALKYYQMYADMAPDAKNHAEVAKEITRLHHALGND